MKLFLKKFKHFLSKNTFLSIIFLVFLISILWLKEINYLFYDTLESPDFNLYRVYLQHFFNNQITNKEQGLMYYYLHSLNYYYFYSEFNNFNFFIHKSIQQVNFYIFIFGLIGYYYLLKFLNFSKKIIFPTLIFLNFFPPSIAMRLVFKPEILAFALLPWIIYLLENFTNNKKKYHLYISIPLIISAITIKGNVLLIISIYLLISYFKIFFNTPIRTLIALTLVSSALFIFVSFENYNSNGHSLLDLRSGSAIEKNYNFKAPYSIIYKVDMYKLISSPIKNNHADSFIGITLLETSGDYFSIYWDNDDTDFFRNRKELITFTQSNEIRPPQYNRNTKSLTIYQQRTTDVYLYQTTGLLISIILFYYLLNYFFRFKIYRKFLIAIFIGMAVLLFHAITGLPKNNFNPELGDTFKPLYYSFVFNFSFAFMIAIHLKEHFRRIFYIAIYIIICITLIGFPKTENYSPEINFLQKVETSVYCPLEKLLFSNNENLDNLDCKNQNSLKANENTGILDTNSFKHKPVNLILLFLNFISVLIIIFEKKLFKFK